MKKTILNSLLNDAILTNLSYDAGNDICSNTEWLKSNQQRKHHSNHRKHRFELLSELTQ